MREWPTSPNPRPRCHTVSNLGSIEPMADHVFMNLPLTAHRTAHIAEYGNPTSRSAENSYHKSKLRKPVPAPVFGTGPGLRVACPVAEPKLDPPIPSADSTRFQTGIRYRRRFSAMFRDRDRFACRTRSGKVAVGEALAGPPRPFLPSSNPTDNKRG